MQVRLEWVYFDNLDVWGKLMIVLDDVRRGAALLFLVCCLCGFRWSFLLGELTWEKVQIEIRKSYPDVKQISVEQALDYLGTGRVIFVDVRELGSIGSVTFRVLCTRTPLSPGHCHPEL